jgi:hypothetical protein
MDVFRLCSQSALNTVPSLIGVGSSISHKWAESPPSHAPLGEDEEHVPRNPQGEWYAGLGNTFQLSYCTAFHHFWQNAHLMSVPICASRGDMGVGRPCAAVACAFIALAAWVRRLPFWLPNSCVVTECLQSGHLNVVKPLMILIM